MAVVQISKIQIRRGQKNVGSGIPQLSSGELGWAIDSQELYVGNGAVSEGAPKVGNTKVLTEHDDLFTLIDTYAYRSNDPYVVTGESATNPVKRTLQDRLDDTVTGRAFGLNGIEGADATVKLQNAIDQLYLNSSSLGTAQSRVILNLEPGIYSLNNTIYLPPHTTIVGAGSDKTIIKKTTAGDIFRTENQLIAGTANKTTRADDSGSSVILQARNIRLEGLTLQSTVAGSQGLVLQSCRDSVFRDVKIQGTWSSGDTIPSDYASDIGIELNSLSGSVETKGNLFENVEVTGFGYGVMSNWDINNNSWDHCKFDGLGYGIVFGIDMVLGAPSTGQSTGPVNNSIAHSEFININYQAIWIHNGTSNSSSHNSFVLVGNDGSSDANGNCSIIKFAKVGNSTHSEYFARTKELSYTPANLTGKIYYPEVETLGSWSWRDEHQITISPGTNVKAIRLPSYKNQNLEVDYTLKSNNYSVSRSGKLDMTIDTSSGDIEWADDYHFAGADGYLESIKFNVGATDEDGDSINDTISISYTSTMPVDDQTTMTFKATSKQSV